MEKRTLKLGILIICLVFCVIGIYELQEKRNSIKSIVFNSKINGLIELDGFEEQEDLIKYFVYQIQTSNLEGGLRGCATDLANYFSLENFIYYTGRFEGTDLLPPSDTDSTAYQAIGKAELSAEYIEAISDIIELQNSGETLDFLGMEENLPIELDGMYYQRQENICEILGARSISEVIVYLGMQEKTYELRCSLVRYKKYWKILAFHELRDNKFDEIDIRESNEERREIISLEEYAEIVLPQNYDIVNDCSEEDPEYLIKRFFLYLQREDVISALAYMDIYDGMEGFDGSKKIFTRQGKAAKNLQEFYYRILLIDKDYYDWILRDLNSRRSELVTQLSTTNMLFIDLKRVKEVSNENGNAVYEVKFLYNGHFLTKKVKLHYHTGGWKIQSIN